MNISQPSLKTFKKQVANNQGWIKINWSVADKVVEKVRKEADQLKGKKAQVGWVVGT